MFRRFDLTPAVLLIVGLGLGAPAESVAQPKNDPISQFVGTWRGNSKCVAKNTACHDETVVYRISAVPDQSGDVAVSADKIVDSKPINMGAQRFHYDPDSQAWICSDSHGIWRLKVSRGTAEGTLTTADGVLFRRVVLRRQP